MSNPQVAFSNTTFHGQSILARRRDTIARVTLQTQLEQLRSTGRYDCFKLEWKPIYENKSNWPVPPHLFWDSDLAKWIEGACYFLKEKYDAQVDNAIREIVATIRSAQQEDGYLNLHYIRVEPEKRWSNLQDMHELYNAGHLIEAALAHNDYYKNDDLLEPIQKYVSLIRKTFGPGEGQWRGYPGHPEIELALLRLHKATGSEDAYELARFFLEERGNPTGQDGKHYYTWEQERREESPWMRPDSHPVQRQKTHWYCQAHLPILQQQSVEGHSVRAMYLLTAVADMLCISETDKNKTLQDPKEWHEALARLWNNMVDKKMYLTGGIGAMKQWEGFGIDYFLPQGTDEGGCYAETCASIGVMMLAERLLELDLNGRYADIMELCLYNGVMTAMSLEGKAFTYVNQLASSEQDKSVREEWFECSCCPPNLTRLFGSLGGYLWHFDGADSKATINVYLYTTAKLQFEVDGRPVVLEQKSNWPWEGNIMFQLSADKIETTVRLRIPAWAGEKFTLTPSAPSAKIKDGFLELDPAYLAAHPAFALHIHGFEPRYLSPHPYTNQNTVTLARGPIVYCVEDHDNPWEENHFKNVAVQLGTTVTEEQLEFEGEPYIALKTAGRERSIQEWADRAPGGDPGAVACAEAPGTPRELVFVPYYLRANRGGKGHMRVGLSRV
ncbi:DUF1680-domain-containing protein [Thozetella sp. PMI_491]|nr:DUF1680-domain-containing protein [Thozetella sp. PMI_491]